MTQLINPVYHSHAMNIQKPSELVRGAREKLGISQRLLAEILESTRDRIANYENERCRVPGDIVLKIQELERQADQNASSSG